MASPLTIPPEDKERGLRVRCKLCKKEVSKICRQTGLPLAECKNGDRHTFKIIYVHPKTKEKRAKTIPTRNLTQAKEEAKAFLDEIENGVVTLPPLLQPKKKKEEAPELLIEAVSKYLAFKEGVDVPFHKQKKLEGKWLGELRRGFDFLLESLYKHKHDPTTFTLDEFLDDFIVGEICEELEKCPKYGKRTYNKSLGFYSSFEYWLFKKYHVPYEGLFEDVPRKKGKKEPEAITEQEFDRLLEIITPDNGIKFVNYKSKKRENHYYPWLKTGFRIALESGGRRPGIVYLKFTDIVEKDGKPGAIRIPDDKLNNQFKLTGEEMLFLNIETTEGMLALLTELGYDQYKGTERYLLAPDIINNRHTMLAKLTKAFTHYYSLLNTGRHLTLYACRRANISIESLKREPGKPTDHHKNRKVEDKYYIDPKIVAAAKSGRKVFPSSKKT